MARRRDVGLPLPPEEDLTDEEAAELERYVSAPGWRLDEPDFPAAPVVQILAGRWRRTPPEVQQAMLADARRGVLWPAGIRSHARRYPPSNRYRTPGDHGAWPENGS